MQFLKVHGVFILIFFVCGLLRFIPLFDYQFTFDELSGLDRTQFNSFGEVIEKGVKIDAHPAFVQLVIYYLASTFGYVNWIIKLPFLLLSLGAIVYAYAFGLRFFSKQTGLFAAVIFSFSLIFIYYAPIARMYISGVFFSLGLLYHFYAIFFSIQKHTRDYFFLGLFALLSAFNHHINSLFAFTVCVSGLFLLNKVNYKAYLFTCMITVGCYLPHLPVTLYQISVPGIGRDAGGWLEAPQFSVLFSFIKVLFGTGKTYLVIGLVVLISIALNKNLLLGKKRWLLVIIFLINFLIIFFYSIFRSPVYQNSVMLFSCTALVLFVCSLITFTDRRIFAVTVSLIVLVLLYKSYIKKDYLHQAVKTVYEYQFERTLHYKKLYGDAAVYPIFFDCDTLMKKIYFGKFKTRFDCKTGSDSLISYSERKIFPVPSHGRTGDTTISSFRLFSDFISGLKSDYVLISSATPMYHEVIREHFPYLIENTQTQAISLKVFSRRAGDKNKTVSDDQIVIFSDGPSPGKIKFPEKPLPLQVDSTNEFPFAVQGAYPDLVTKEGEMILSRIRIQNKGAHLKDLESCIVLKDETTGELFSYAAKMAGDFKIKNDSVVRIYSESFAGTFHDRVKNNDQLTFYLWNRGKENFVLRDFEVLVLDYWPQKWSYWK